MKKIKEKDIIKDMTILAIETSCDDTCVAILEIRNSKLEIRSNIVSSQVEIHKKWGGVYPTLAKREHQKNLLPVLIRALKQSKLLKISKSKFLISKQIQNTKFQTLKTILEREEILFKNLKIFLINYRKPKIDAVAVTVGPGLEPCLWVGINFARALSYFWQIPIIPVSHIEAHILANLLPQISEIPNSQFLISKQIEFPAICLVVSGGHTQLILMRNFGRYKILGETRDDAAGECFDKVARILGLGYPGGPVIAAEAAKIQMPDAKCQIKLPRPMIHQENYDFSFSGLKTAVLYDFKSRPKKIKKSKAYIRAMCKETQQAIIDVILHKVMKAAKEYRAKTIILGGGVVANNELRKQFKEKIKNELPNIQYLMPNVQLCTDNAAMVGTTGYYHWLKVEGRRQLAEWKKIKAEANLRLG